VFRASASFSEQSHALSLSSYPNETAALITFHSPALPHIPEIEANEMYDCSSIGLDQHERLFDAYNFEVTKDTFRIDNDHYAVDKNANTRGLTNPTIVEKLFWKYMVYTNISAWEAMTTFGEPQTPLTNHIGREAQDLPTARDRPEEQNHLETTNPHINTNSLPQPIWCFKRVGNTRTRLPDGRIICVGGEHEDFYDPDFCIYNGK